MRYKLLKVILALLIYCYSDTWCDNRPFALCSEQDIRKNDSVLDIDKTQFSKFFKDPLIEDDRYFGIVPKEIERIIRIYKNDNPALENEHKAPSLILFHGPVGIGKSAAAKLIALRTKRYYTELDASLLLKEGEKGIDTLKQLFYSARQSKRPVIIIVNELQAIFHVRKGSCERKVLREALEHELSQQDPFILCIGETSNFASIDNSIKEQCKGFCIEIDFPDTKNRETIIRHYIASDSWCLSNTNWHRIRFSDEFYKRFSEQTRDMNCKEITKIVDGSTLIAAIDIVRPQVSARTNGESKFDTKKKDVQTEQPSTIKSFVIDTGICLVAYFLGKWCYDAFL